MSTAVFLLTAAVFTYLARTDMSASVLPWELVIWVVIAANVAAMVYMARVNNSVYIHQRRAKAVLERTWPSLWAIDQQFPQRWVGKAQMRPSIQTLLHLLLVVAGLWVLRR